MVLRHSRRTFTRLLCLIAVPEMLHTARAGMLSVGTQATSPQFVHPGMLHNSADLRRMRDAVRRQIQPIFAGFGRLRDDPHSQLTYKPAGASVEVGRNPNVRADALVADSNAAYQLALMGHITEDPQYFERSAAILDDWASTLERITGADAVLCAALAPFKLANAAELLRAGDSSWSQTSVLRFKKFLREVVLPVIDNFAPFANGNWDTAAMKTMISIAIFSDDRELFDRALVYYMHGCGDGRLEHYIYANGQCQESGRDQQHTQLGLAHIGDCCEMAWHQGLDLYGMTDNRLLLGFEYTARYEVGEPVPFVPDVDRTGKYRHAVISPRSPLRPVYEQIYNHYAKRRGLPAPWTAAAAEKVRPEGPGFGADHTGFGTLLYSRTPDEPIETVPSAQPAGLYASDGEGALRLSWVPLAVASSYTLFRSLGGLVQRIPVHGADDRQDDRTIVADDAYRYRVEAGHAGATSGVVSAVAGLPKGWTLSGLGDRTPQGAAFCSGDTWRMSAAGVAGADVFSGLAFLARPLASQEVIFSATLLPLFASQFLCAGLACIGREGGSVLLLLVPGKGSTGEHVVWTVRLLTRAHGNVPFSVKGEVVLAAAAVQYGRLYAPLGLRFRKTNATWTAECTTDASVWATVGNCDPFPSSSSAGMVLNSGIAGVSTEVLWDQVSATGAGEASNISRIG